MTITIRDMIEAVSRLSEIGVHASKDAIAQMSDEAWDKHVDAQAELGMAVVKVVTDFWDDHPSYDPRPGAHPPQLFLVEDDPYFVTEGETETEGTTSVADGAEAILADAHARFKAEKNDPDPYTGGEI